MAGVLSRIRRWFFWRSSSRKLLRAEIETAQVRLRTITRILNANQETPAAAENAIDLLEEALDALESRNSTHAQHCFYAAIRWETISMAQLVGDEIDAVATGIVAGAPLTRSDPALVAPDDAGVAVEDGGRTVTATGTATREARSQTRRAGILDAVWRRLSGTAGNVLSRGRKDRPAATRDASSSQKINPYISAMNPMQLRADRLRFEAIESLSSWRREAVLDLLNDEDGNPKKKVSLEEMLAALKILHEYYLTRDLRVKTLRAQLTYFVLISFTTMFAILAIAQPRPAFEDGPVVLNWFLNLVLALVGVIPLRFGAGVSPFDPAAVGRPEYLAFVVLFGVLGAAISGILPLTSQLRKTRLSESAVTFRLAIARVAMGGAAALALFAFLQSGLLNFGALTPGLVLSVSFAAGFSERLLVRAVETLTRQQVETDRNE